MQRYDVLHTLRHLDKLIHGSGKHGYWPETDPCFYGSLQAAFIEARKAMRIALLIADGWSPGGAKAAVENGTVDENKFY